jgi:endonuclease/exonuclease/phosphatase (EEP) superfamily protein YafD
LDVFNLHSGCPRASEPGRSEPSRVLPSSPPFRGAPCLVAGDFNDWRAQLVPIFVEILEFKSATRHRFGYKRRSERTRRSRRPARLDKIFYRGPLRLLGRAAAGSAYRASRAIISLSSPNSNSPELGTSCSD